MLIFPSIAGLVVFIYGLVYMGDDIPSYDTCEGDMKDEIMCPICDPCEFWRLKVDLFQIFLNFKQKLYRKPVI